MVDKELIIKALGAIYDAFDQVRTDISIYNDHSFYRAMQNLEDVIKDLEAKNENS